MNKVITVNLSGNAYQVDEDGYIQLQSYIDQARAQLNDGVDKAEVLADLERAIAEKCAAVLHAHKTVVTGAEIAHILKDIGPVEADDSQAPKESGTADAAIAFDKAAAINTSADRNKNDFYAPKRLHKIPEGAMVGGVCNGIAVYFGFDVAIVRVVFALLTVFTGGLWLLAYLIMLIVVPVAYTDQQRAEARGVWSYQPKNFQQAQPSSSSDQVSDHVTAPPRSEPHSPRSTKRILPAIILCAFLGWLGVHRFYVGKIGTGILQILTLGGLGVWVLIDLVMLAVGAFTDIDGHKITEWV